VCSGGERVQTTVPSQRYRSHILCDLLVIEPLHVFLDVWKISVLLCTHHCISVANRDMPY